MPISVLGTKFVVARRHATVEAFLFRYFLRSVGVLLILYHGHLSANNNDIGYGNGHLFAVWQNINLLLQDTVDVPKSQLDLPVTASSTVTLEDLAQTIDLFEQHLNRLQPSLNEFSPAIREEFTHLSFAPDKLKQSQLYISSVKLLLQLALLAKNHNDDVLVGSYFALDEHAQVPLEQIYQQVVRAKQLLGAVSLPQVPMEASGK